MFHHMKFRIRLDTFCVFCGAEDESYSGDVMDIHRLTWSGAKMTPPPAKLPPEWCGYSICVLVSIEGKKMEFSGGRVDGDGGTGGVIPCSVAAETSVSCG